MDELHIKSDTEALAFIQNTPGMRVVKLRKLVYKGSPGHIPALCGKLREVQEMHFTTPETLGWRFEDDKEYTSKFFALLQEHAS